MQVEKIIEKYLEYLESSSYEDIIKLFSADAVIYSPLYGKISARDFYKKLFKDTLKSRIRLINIFISRNNPRIGAGYFYYDWTLENGRNVLFECIDIFKLNSEGKIRELRIIYDTSKVRIYFKN